ncbi:hypothetical protein ACLOJK_015149 [Asimina triloba]
MNDGGVYVCTDAPRTFHQEPRIGAYPGRERCFGEYTTIRDRLKLASCGSATLLLHNGVTPSLPTQ